MNLLFAILARGKGLTRDQISENSNADADEDTEVFVSSQESTPSSGARSTKKRSKNFIIL